MTSIVIGGDLCPGVRSTPYLVKGDADAVFEGLAPVLREADLALANLEGPLVKQLSPITKIGPHHAFEENCIKGIRAAGFRLLNLGNNHIMDHGYAGLANTLRCCEEHGIACVGAGENREAAGRVWVKEINGLQLGIWSCTEHEFGLATAKDPGTNPLNLMNFVRTVQTHRKKWDYLLVLLHGGNEYYPYPRPSLQELCRFMIEQGAGAVICQHSHCVGCHETYRGGQIVYGQGNLLCDNPSQPCEAEGLLVTLRIEEDRTSSMELTPFAHSASSPGPVLMNAEQRMHFLQQFEERSRAIQDQSFVEREWEKFCQQNPYNYLSLLQGYPRRIRELDQKFHFLRFLRSRQRLLMLLHLLRCESHHEAIMGAINTSLR